MVLGSDGYVESPELKGANQLAVTFS